MALSTCGNSRRLAMVLIKTGLAQMGVSWVLFTVMGQRVFPLHWHGIGPERGSVLGMSMLMGARGVGAIVGRCFPPDGPDPSQRRLRMGVLLGFMAVALGYSTLGRGQSLWQACFCVVLAHSGGSTVWVFSTTLVATQHRRQVPRPCVLGGVGVGHGHPGHRILSDRICDRSRYCSANGRNCNRGVHADS